MNAKELAVLLNGRQYGEEITKAEESLARENGLVVVFGYSDDNTELRGAIYDEVGGFGSHEILFDSEGIPVTCDCEDCPYYEKAKEKAKKITANWGKDGYSWFYTADFPCEFFDIFLRMTTNFAEVSYSILIH